MKTENMHLETLEERALFAGVQEAVEPVDSIDVEEETLCYGAMGTAGQYLSSIGEGLEVPGAWVQSVGDSIYTSFDTPPEYPEGGIYRDPVSQTLAMTGTIASGASLLGQGFFNVTGIVFEACEFVTNLGSEEGNIVSLPFAGLKGISYGFGSLFGSIAESGKNFADSNTYEVPYEQFVDAHHAAFSTQAGTMLGSSVYGVGSALRAPGWALHQAGDSLVKVCDIADVTSHYVKDLYAGVSLTYNNYFGPSEAAVNDNAMCDVDALGELSEYIALHPPFVTTSSLS